MFKYTKSLFGRADTNDKEDGASIQSVLTDHTEDYLEDWRELRRELIANGFKGGKIKQHQKQTQSYIKDLEQSQGDLAKFGSSPQTSSRKLTERPTKTSDSRGTKLDHSNRNVYHFAYLHLEAF